MVKTCYKRYKKNKFANYNKRVQDKMQNKFGQEKNNNFPHQMGNSERHADAEDGTTNINK